MHTTRLLILRVLIGQLDLHITSPNLAGRLSRYVCNWEKITQVQWVLQFIAGYQLEVTQTQYQGKSHKGSHAQGRSTKNITGDQGTPNKGCNCGSQLSTNSYISQIFLVEKKWEDIGS